MSFTAALWVALAGLCLVRSVVRPAWAVALYLMTFFAAPHLWWWGKDFPAQRYSLLAGFLLLACVVCRVLVSSSTQRQPLTIVHWAALGIVFNATLVHYLLAARPDISWVQYLELIKFVLLFFLFSRAIEDKRDLRIVLVALALGAAYLGYEITVNERGNFTGARLEGVGAPGADSSNGLASVMLLVLPLIGSLFIGGSKGAKLLALVSLPLTLNVVLLCNSRGAFLGLIGGGLVFLLLARGPTRKKAIRTLTLGAVALYMLLGDPKILDRFSTTFVGSDQRDNSAASRIEFWKAGMLMLNDFPLGAGGEAFKFVYAGRYLAQVGSDESARSLHNSYLTEATDWGIQGFALKLTFLCGAILIAYRTSSRCRLAGRADDSLVGVAFIVAAISFMITAVFGSFFGNEWLYWAVALLVRYGQLYEVESTTAKTSPQADGVRWAAPNQAAVPRQVAGIRLCFLQEDVPLTFQPNRIAKGLGL